MRMPLVVRLPRGLLDWRCCVDSTYQGGLRERDALGVAQHYVTSSLPGSRAIGCWWSWLAVHATSTWGQCGEHPHRCRIEVPPVVRRVGSSRRASAGRRGFVKGSRHVLSTSSAPTKGSVGRRCRHAVSCPLLSLDLSGLATGLSIALLGARRVPPCAVVVVSISRVRPLALRACGGFFRCSPLCCFCVFSSHST